MLDDENIVLKNKVSELKERLKQIYSQFATDSNKSKAFENEFSLYLKACEHARNERAQNVKLQHDVIKFGLAILTVVLAFTVYVFSMQTLPGMIVLLGFGFISTGFMFLLLTGEIQIIRAEEYCAEVETYFKQNRWSTELHEALNLSGIPLWEAYRSTWDKDLFSQGPYRKTAVYAPFRIAITVTDVVAFLYFIQAVASHGPEMSKMTMLTGFIVWVMVVIIQMLLVDAVINKVDNTLARKKGSQDVMRKKVTIWQAGSWFKIVKLFFLLDILSPKESRKQSE